MVRNIFDRAKDVVRQLQSAPWQDVSFEEAAKALVTESDVYFDTGRKMQDGIERYNFPPALAKQFKESDITPQKKSINLPSEKDIGVLAHILWEAFSCYNVCYPSDRAYSDFEIVEDKNTINLIVVNPTEFDFESAIQKLDFYKIAAPRLFKEFRYGDETWVATHGDVQPPILCPVFS